MESPQARFKRFNAAQAVRAKWTALLENSYALSLPRKNDFFRVPTPGEIKTFQLFDSTAVNAVQVFANNMQSTLMPPFQRWANLEAGADVPQAQRSKINEQLVSINKKIFEFINRSNFAQVINESFQELAIGTGVILINEGTLVNPLQFTSVPIANVVFSEGKDHMLTNFWMEWLGTPREMMAQWPTAKLNDKLRDQIEFNPDGELRLIIGSILDPEADPSEAYLYYVSTEDGNFDIFKESREYSSFIGFRFSRAHDEAMGRGPIITGLPFIRVLNQIAELTMSAASLIGFPPMMAASSKTLNPFTVRIEPGSLIAVDPTDSLGGGPPIQSLQTGGDLNFINGFRALIKDEVQKMLFAGSLPDAVGPKMTATEISIRQQQAIKERTAVFGRLISELVRPVINNILIILKKKKIIPIKELEINNSDLQIRFQSPLAQVQADEDVKRSQEFIGIMMQTFGPQEGVATINFDNYPEWVAEKLSIDPTIVNQDWKGSPVVQKFKQLIEQGPQGQPQAGAPGGAVNQPAQPETGVAPESVNDTLQNAQAQQEGGQQ